MYKYTLLIFYFIISYISYSQIYPVINSDDYLSDENYLKSGEKIKLKTLNLNLTAGYSDISGFVGLNLDIKQVGLDIGISTISWYENDILRRKAIIGGGLSYYLKGIDNGYSTLHPYISMGYSFNSSYYVLSTPILPTGRKSEIIWGDKFSIIAGVVINSKYSPFSTKLGLGYQVSNNSPLAIDFVFKYRFFTKQYEK